MGIFVFFEEIFEQLVGCFCVLCIDSEFNHQSSGKLIHFYFSRMSIKNIVPNMIIFLLKTGMFSASWIAHITNAKLLVIMSESNIVERFEYFELR